MFEGIGIQTILGVLTTVGVGVTTPADCYVGLGAHDPGSTFDIDNPAGTLGCQADFNSIRVFAEHISSPANGNDFPGINHAGAKFLLPLTSEVTTYAGASVAIPSKQLNGSPVLSMIGIEAGPDTVKFYSEYIISIDKPADGMLTGGIKFIF